MAEEPTKILIVEDDEEVFLLLRDVLDPKGYYCILEGQGENVIDRVIAEKPKLILLDIKLIGIDGYTVCRRLKKESRTKHIPVIFISALKTQRDVLEAKEAGGFYFMGKPFDLKLLESKIQKALKMSVKTVSDKKIIQVLYAQSEYVSELADPSSALFQLMRASSYRVNVLRDSREVVRKTREANPDVVILDLDDALLPVWTIEEALWRNRYTTNIPRVIITGIPQNEWPYRPNLPRLSLIIKKPIDAVKLFTIIEESMMQKV